MLGDMYVYNSERNNKIIMRPPLTVTKIKNIKLKFTGDIETLQIIIKR